MHIHPLVGLTLDGAHLTERDLARGVVAGPVWGPRGLIADLELRCGVGPVRVEPMARLLAVRTRAEALAARAPTFYSRSLETDPWATASALLAMRDELVLAGWDGEADAGLPRVRTLAALDRLHRDGPLPPGEVDRIERVTRAAATAPYARLTLVERTPDWPAAWQRLFARLAALGVVIDDGAGERARPREAGEASNDLARIDAALRAGVPLREPLTPSGDGSFVVLEAETPDPLAEAVAALAAAELGADPRRTIAILRTADFGALEAALPRFGLPRLGGLRAPGVPLAGAFLPLVMALVHTPFDAEAALDLVLMPASDLRTEEARDLAEALQSAPGLGSRWTATLAALDARARARGEARSEGLERLLEWVSAPAGVTLDEIARRVALLDKAIARRTLRHRLPPADDRRTATGDAATIEALEAARGAMAAWLRALPSELAGADGPHAAHAIDQLLVTFGDIAASTLTRHEAGALERIDDAGALVADVDTLIWWGFVDPGTPAPSAFRDAERAELARAGVVLEGPEAMVARRVGAWRAALGRARRVVLAVPGRIAGARQAPHPLWAELRGRLGWRSEEAFAPVVVKVAELAERGHLGGGEGALALARGKAPAIEWAPASVKWNVTANMTPESATSYSVSRLETLFKCPLRFVLERQAGLRERPVGVVGAMPLVLGNLGHRLVQVLHEQGRLSSRALSEIDLAAVVEDMMQGEAAILFAPGRSIEREDIARQLADAVTKAVAWVEGKGLEVVAVEEEVATTCDGRTVEGRLDLRARQSSGAEAGGDVIVDFKWSTRRHADGLVGERAVQLAAYASAFRKDGRAPRGAYIGLRDGAVAVADAPLLARIWARAEAMIAPLEAALARGEVHVTGTSHRLDLAAALGVRDGVAIDHDSVCDYCRFDLICGRGLAAADAAGDDEEGDDDGQ